MATEEELKKWQKGLESTFPIFGKGRRRRAMEVLETHLDDPDVVPLLLQALASGDEELSTRASEALSSLEFPTAVDVLCDEAIQDPDGLAAKLCVRTGKRPSDHERACLFLFVTRQLDAYFQEDFEFQNLRLQYDRADEKVRAHVMEVVRSGDRRCAGFFGTRSKPLRECSEAEIKLALDSWVRHQDWQRLFHGCLELPLKYSLPAFARLGQSGWEPEFPDLRSVYRQILADAGDEPPSPPKQNQPSATSSVFEQWLAQGTDGEMGKLSEPELVKRLDTATPPEGVTIVAALAAGGTASNSAIEAVKNSPHWLVRLAGHAVGLYPPDLTSDGVQDSNYWITELAAAKGVLDFWPGQATPADLETLSAAPAEAWAGKLGTARKVLRTVMSHRITTGTFEPMIVEVAEFAGEFVEAAEVEFEAGSAN